MTNHNAGYKVRYTYEGDHISNFESTCIVVADTKEEAIMYAKLFITKGWHFNIEDTVADLNAYFVKFPLSNISVYDHTGQIR